MSGPLPPNLTADFDPTKNPGIKATDVLPGTKKVLWTCNLQHAWVATINSRLSGTGCPICANRKVLKNFNDLLFLDPLLAAEWHPVKNGNLQPDQVTAGTVKKVWWLCSKGHEWEAVIEQRHRNKTGCPICAGQKVLIGFNDLATTHTSLIKEWHPTKNGTLLPTQVIAGSRKKVWWLCSKGHEWEASINKRAGLKRGCVFCSNQVVLAGYNDFLTKQPLLSQEWHPTKNGTVLPQHIVAGTNKKYWWLCAKGHEWETSPAKRIFSGRNCPYCVNQKILAGDNDMATTHSFLLKEFHPTKNGTLDPTKISHGYTKKVWWLGESCGHEWETKITDKLRFNCPKCPHNVSQGERDITKHLTALGLFTENNSKQVIPGLDLDIYVPEKKVAIEYNGLYWHTEDRGRTKEFHYNKWVQCQKNGIQLIQIWEDDWKKSPEKILAMLDTKLGVSKAKKIFGRKTRVTTVGYEEARVFLNTNHIQGEVRGSYYLGLKEKSTGLLVALMVLRKEDNGNTFNIVRYATNANVIGGFTKLLAYSSKIYSPERYITFSDHCISDGGLYRNNGFTVDKELAPDYMYVSKGERKHKFGYRLKRFKNDPDLLWKEGLTEKQLAKLNNLPRIWDAGKTRWVKEL